MAGGRGDDRALGGGGEPVTAGARPAGDVLIRPLDTARDSAEAVAVICESSPHRVLTGEAWRHDVERTPARAERRNWVAVARGEIVAVAFASRRWYTTPIDSAMVGVTVRRDQRRQGIGSRLYELAEAHALRFEPTRLYTYHPDEEPGRRFAAARGFRPLHAGVQSLVDPRTVDVSSLDRLPDGVELVPLADLHDRLHDVYAVDAEASLDEPGSGQVSDRSYEEWLDDVENPLVSHQASFCAIAGGTVASFAQVYVDPGRRRARNGFTGTLRSQRRRGLATLAKLAAIRRLAEAGIETLWTSNDETNATMLGINRRLGYVPGFRELEQVREL